MAWFRAPEGLGLDALEQLLEVADHGLGITAKQASSSKSLGLTGMRERARLWNGSVTIKGTEGKGTTVLVEIPLDDARTDKDAK